MAEDTTPAKDTAPTEALRLAEELEAIARGIASAKAGKMPFRRAARKAYWDARDETAKREIEWKAATALRSLAEKVGRLEAERVVHLQDLNDHDDVLRILGVESDPMRTPVEAIKQLYAEKEAAEARERALPHRAYVLAHTVKSRLPAGDDQYRWGYYDACLEVMKMIVTEWPDAATGEPT